MADADFGGEEQSGQGGDEPGQQIGAHVDDVDANAVALGGLFAKADGAHLEAAAGAIQPDVADDRRGENDEEGEWARNRCASSRVR